MHDFRLQRLEWVYCSELLFLIFWCKSSRDGYIRRAKKSSNHTSKSNSHYATLYLNRLEGNEVEWTGKAKITKAQLLAAGEESKATFLPSQASKEIPFLTSGFSAEGDPNIGDNGTLPWDKHPGLWSSRQPGGWSGQRTCLMRLRRSCRSVGLHWQTSLRH